MDTNTVGRLARVLRTFAGQLKWRRLHRDPMTPRVTAQVDALEALDGKDVTSAEP